MSLLGIKWKETSRTTWDASKQSKIDEEKKGDGNKDNDDNHTFNKFGLIILYDDLELQ